MWSQPKSDEELKADIILADPGDRFAVYDRYDLDSEDWRKVILELYTDEQDEQDEQERLWRLFDEHGTLLDEHPDCPYDGFTQSSLLADVGFTYYTFMAEKAARRPARRGERALPAPTAPSGGDVEEVEEVGEELDYDLYRVKLKEDGRVGTCRTRSGSNDLMVPANKLLVLFDYSPSDVMLVKPEPVLRSSSAQLS